MNELVGFENLDLPEELLASYETLPDNTFLDDDSDVSEDDVSDDEDALKENGDSVANKIVQFFWSSLEGDLSYPVASFPVKQLTTVKMTTMVWKVIRQMSEIQLSSGNHVRTLYGLCDGASYSTAFFE